MRTARTNDEAHLYMDLSPCRCGSSEFDRRNTLVADGGELASVYQGPCKGCGAIRRFAFRLPADIRPLTEPMSFGGPEPSELVDAGQFLALSDRHAQSVPASPDGLDGRQRAAVRRRLEIAIAAVDEVLKFIPPGAEVVPEQALFTDTGLAVHRAEPGRFRRIRLEAVRAAYADVAARFAVDE